MNARLIALAGPSRGKSFDLTEDEFSIGRDPSNSLALTDDAVSRQRALIRNAGSDPMILDLNSRNGTYVNAVPIRERKLEPGDQIQIGDSLLLFVLEDDARALQTMSDSMKLWQPVSELCSFTNRIYYT